MRRTRAGCGWPAGGGTAAAGGGSPGKPPAPCVALLGMQKNCFEHAHLLPMRYLSLPCMSQSGKSGKAFWRGGWLACNTAAHHVSELVQKKAPGAPGHRNVLPPVWTHLRLCQLHRPAEKPLWYSSLPMRGCWPASVRALLNCGRDRTI